jgi:hypothetical protein
MSSPETARVGTTEVAQRDNGCEATPDGLDGHGVMLRDLCHAHVKIIALFAHFLHSVSMNGR